MRRTDLVVVQHPEDAGDLGTWAVSVDNSSCSSSSAGAFGFARGNKPSVWELLLLLHLRLSFNLDRVQTLLERTSLGLVVNLCSLPCV